MWICRATRVAQSRNRPRTGGLCCDRRVVENDHRSRPAAFGRRATGHRGGGVRPSAPRRSVRRLVAEHRVVGACQEHADRPRHRRRHRDRGLLRDRLAVLRPGEPVLGEEQGGSNDGRDGQLTWVLDPIDGTVNFVYGIETYAVSVGVQRDGASVAGAVANVPTGALYSAAVGHGAHLQRGGVTTRAAGQRRFRAVNVVGRHRLFLRRRATDDVRPRSSPRSCPPSATSVASDRAHSISAWWPQAVWTPTTRTVCMCGTGPRAR